MIQLKPPSTRLFDSLPTRPPTPPRDPSAHITSAEPGVLSDVTNAIIQQASRSPKRPSIHTPPGSSPLSSAENIRGDSGAGRKRVEWSPWTDYHKPSSSSASQQELDLMKIKPLPPSRERVSTKSILKRHEGKSLTGEPLPFHSPSLRAHDNLAIMLESSLDQLGSKARSGRLDAYTMLTRTLKAYDNFPEPGLIKENMKVFESFIRRDLQATSPDTASPDAALIVQALKLLTVFIWTPQISTALTDSFRIFVVERAASVLESGGTAKMLITHYLHLMGQQKFSAKVITAERASRLLTALVNLDRNVRGNGVLSERLMVFQRLLTQTPQLMATRAETWLYHLFTGMLSKLREVRSRAIGFGTEVGKVLGSNPQFSRTVAELMDREFGKSTLSEWAVARLKNMGSERMEASQVAQIWGVVVLLLRGRPHQLENWQNLGSWLVVIQGCFNSSELSCRYQANIAWSRFISAISPNEKTGSTMIALLRQPIAQQLEKKTTDKTADRARLMTFGTLHTLLYHSLGPGLSVRHLRLFWDQYVSQIVGKTLIQGGKDVEHGCLILSALLDGGHARSWSANRVHEGPAISLEELPRIDPKWVRSNSGVVLKEIERALSSAHWSASAADNFESPRQCLWTGYVKTIAEAGSKEVRITDDLMMAVAHTTTLLCRFWQNRPTTEGSSTSSDQAFIGRFSFLVKSFMTTVGSMPLTDRLLRRTAPDAFEAVGSASDSESCDELLSPMHHLLRLWVASPPDVQASSSLGAMMHELLEVACKDRSSSSSRLRFLRECYDVLRRDDLSVSEYRVSMVIWKSVAEHSVAALSDLPATDQSLCLDDSMRNGPAFKDVVRILGQGRGTKSDPGYAAAWMRLLQCATETAARVGGIAAVMVAVLGPLAQEYLLDSVSMSDGILPLLSHLLQQLTYAPASQSYEAAQKQLWGKRSPGTISTDSDPYSLVHQLADRMLVSSYGGIDSYEADELCAMLSSVSGMIDRCPASFLPVLLHQAQHGLSAWIEDAEHKLKPSSGSDWELSLAITNLSAVVTAAIERLPSRDSVACQRLEALLLAGLRSSRGVVVAQAVDSWRKTFGAEKDIQYSDALKAALSEIHAAEELRLPSLLLNVQDKTTANQLSPSPGGDATAKAPVLIKHPYPESVTDRAVPANQTADSCLSSVDRERPASLAAALPGIEASSLPMSKNQPRDSSVYPSSRGSPPALERVEADGQHRFDAGPERSSTPPRGAKPSIEFADLPAAPTTHSQGTRFNLPALSLNSGFASGSAVVREGSVTPTLPPPNHSLMEEFLGSSPTPRPGQSTDYSTIMEEECPRSPYMTRGRYCSEMIEVEDPPSSPPRSLDAPLVHGRTTQGQDISGASSTSFPSLDVDPLIFTSNESPDQQLLDEQLRTMEDAAAAASEADQQGTSDLQKSSLESAVSSRCETLEVQGGNERCVTPLASLADGGPSFTEPGHAPQTRKRKRPTSESKSVKKSRRESHLMDSTSTSSPLSHDDNVLDCIVVASTIARTTESSRAATIKAEPSPSPKKRSRNPPAAKSRRVIGTRSKVNTSEDGTVTSRHCWLSRKNRVSAPGVEIEEASLDDQEDISNASDDAAGATTIRGRRRSLRLRSVSQSSLADSDHDGRSRKKTFRPGNVADVPAGDTKETAVETTQEARSPADLPAPFEDGEGPSAEAIAAAFPTSPAPRTAAPLEDSTPHITPGSILDDPVIEVEKSGQRSADPMTVALARAEEDDTMATTGAQEVLQRLQGVMADVQGLELERGEVRKIDDTLFELRRALFRCERSRD
ncbi:MAG: hypothetical protein M1817_000179 [Caeruleum heppii]|nr:MAG: hypothetical protein M1817_000179 [Caeruleum heppii]